MADPSLQAAYRALDDIATYGARAGTGGAPLPGNAAVDAVRAAMRGAPAGSGVFAPYVDDAVRAGGAVRSAAGAAAPVAGRLAGVAARVGVPVMAATQWAPALFDEIVRPSQATQDALAPWQRAAEQASAEGRTVDAIGNRLGAWGTAMAHLGYRGVVLPTMAMAGSNAAREALAPPAARAEPARESAPASAPATATPALTARGTPDTPPVFGGMTLDQALQSMSGLPNRAVFAMLGNLSQRPTPRPSSARDILGADYIRLVREEDAAFRERAAAGRETPETTRAHRERMLRLMGPAFAVNPMEAALAGTLP